LQFYFEYLICKRKGVNTVSSPEELIDVVFSQRMNLGMSKNLNSYFLNKGSIESALSNVFINSNELKKTSDQFDEDYKSIVDENCEITEFTPLVRVYRMDKNDTFAVAYVEQFLMYKVKLKSGVPIRSDIPKEYLVPTDSNGAWVSATCNYFTVVMRKLNDIWKIDKIIDADEDVDSKKIGPLFASSGVNGFEDPPQEKLPLPKDIDEELREYSIGHISNFENVLTPQISPSPNRTSAAQYADSHWNNYNTNKYATFPNDCANFVSQCLYEGGWYLDWYNNGITEEGYPNNRSQEWHIDIGTTNASLSWIQADTLEVYVRGNMDYMNRTAPPPFGGEAGSSVNHVDSYMKGRIGDLVTLDQNSNGSPDHVGIIVAFRSDGVPLVDAHNNDRYHVS